MSENSINFYDISYLNVKGWYVPKFVWTNFSLFVYSIIAAIVGIIFVSRYAKKQRDEFGKQLPTFYISIGLLIYFTFINFFNWWCKFDLLKFQIRTIIKNCLCLQRWCKYNT